MVLPLAALGRPASQPMVGNSPAFVLALPFPGAEFFEGPRPRRVTREDAHVISPILICSAAPLAVEDSRDWLDYVAIWSGAVGALLGALAIAYAAWQSVQTGKTLVLERRLEFELGLLAEIRRQMSITRFQHLSGYVGALIRHPEDETDIALLRAVVGMKSGPEGKRRKGEIAEQARARSADPQAELLKAAAAEVDTAIQRRLER